MRTCFFFSEIGPSDKLYRVEALRCGHWSYPGMENGFEITPAVLAEMKRNFDLGAKGNELPVDGPSRGGEAHSDSDLHDCGWVKGLELSSDGHHLYALFEPTNPDIKQMIDEGSLKYCSSEINLAWFDPEDKSTKKVLEGLALTNRPYVKRMTPIEPLNLGEFAARLGIDVARTGGGSGDDPLTHKEVPMDELAKAQKEIERLKVQLAEKPAAGQSAAELAEVKAQLAEAKQREEAQQARLAELEKSNRETASRFRLAEVKTKLNTLVRAGKCTLPVYTRFLALSTALIGNGQSVIHLGEKIKLAEGKETDKVDVVEEVLDMLNQLPAAISTDPENRAAVLDENGPRQDGDEDEDDALDKAAKAAMKENPKLSYREAAKLAERKLKGGGR